ncbi:hypothetical protein ACS3UN_03200 [Oscillospiraceae bacterium LTW-04]|nr:hypothetical protein RBH76_07265 [Oscillospiraceae bacterium MB24-C1]
MRYGISSMGNVMDGAAMEEQGGVLAQLMAKLPEPVQVLLHVLVVILIAAVIGTIIGKMYAAIKYPDPEKHHIISPKLKVLFICILAACCFWLYTTMTREEPTEIEPGTQEGQSEVLEGGDDLPVSINDGKATVMLG